MVNIVGCPHCDDLRIGIDASSAMDVVGSAAIRVSRFERFQVQKDRRSLGAKA